MATSYSSFKAYAVQLQRWETQQRRRVITNAARAGIRMAHRDAVRRFASRGIGRRIWGQDITAAGGIKKRSNLSVFIKIEKMVWRGNQLLGALKALGLPGLVERGGRTKAHDIPKRPRDPKHPLSFLGRDGRAFAPQVHHPGSRIEARPFLDPALRAHEGLIAAKIDEQLQRSLDVARVA